MREVDWLTREQLKVAFAISDENTSPDEVDAPSPEDLDAPSEALDNLTDV